MCKRGRTQDNPLKFTSRFLFLSIVVLGYTVVPTRADSVTIQNGSFEITNPLSFSCGPGCADNNGPIPGWTIAGGQEGSWQPSSAYLTLPFPNGGIVAFSNGGTISQTLSASLAPDTTYTLSAYVGHRLDGDRNNLWIGPAVQ
jgi:hypothetical protein